MICKKVLYISRQKYYDETENDDENSSLAESLRENRPFGSFVERCWKRFGGKPCEDHLRVALIQPGSSRYERMKVAYLPLWRIKCNKGGTACKHGKCKRPLQ